MHSGLRRIYVLTQFNSLSLQNHLRDGWSIFNTDLGEFVTAVTPPITEHPSIYEGQASALFNNLYLVDGAHEDTLLMVSGEQIYRMDYAAMIDFHHQHDADVTVAVVDRDTALGGAFPARNSQRRDQAAGASSRTLVGEQQRTGYFRPPLALGPRGGLNETSCGPLHSCTAENSHPAW